MAGVICTVAAKDFDKEFILPHYRHRIDRLCGPGKVHCNSVVRILPQDIGPAEERQIEAHLNSYASKCPNPPDHEFKFRHPQDSESAWEALDSIVHRFIVSTERERRGSGRRPTTGTSGPQSLFSRFIRLLLMLFQPR